ncbi:hypothetical protein JHK85_054380 [Glycine max]|nr:hypothetical protein JHK85_054380 [Glycine max]
METRASNKKASHLPLQQFISVTTPLLDLEKEAEVSSSGVSQERVVIEDAEKDEFKVNDCPIEQVRLTVPITDDPTQPALTFRTCVLGLASCNQPFENLFGLAPIITLPLGKLMAATLSTRPVRVPFTKGSFLLNPGPFSLKEHVLITILATSGSSGVHAINIITIVKAFYHRSIHPIGSGMNSLGISSFGLDWNTVAGFLGSPLAIPGFAIINLLIGFVLDIYVVIPVANWSNLYDAKKFPLISSHTFDSTGAIYNVTRILNPITFEIDLNSYNNYSKIYLSNAFVFEYGLGFATLIATISHVALFHGEMILQLVGTVVASSVHFATAWWLLTSIENICDETLLPKGSPWTCPGDDVFYNASIIWGVVGPKRMFSKDGVYPGMNWFFLNGLLAPLPAWLLSRKFPNHK